MGATETNLSWSSQSHRRSSTEFVELLKRLARGEIKTPGRSSTEFVELLKHPRQRRQPTGSCSSTEVVELFLQRRSPWRFSFLPLESDCVPLC